MDGVSGEGHRWNRGRGVLYVLLSTEKPMVLKNT